MFLPIILTIFYSTFLNGFIYIPSAEASIVGSSCSQNGIIEKQDGKLLCMCDGKEVKQDEYCQKAMIFSVHSGLLEITINRGNDSHEQPNILETESLTHKSSIKPLRALRVQSVSVTRGIQSIDEKEPSLLPSSANQCILK